MMIHPDYQLADLIQRRINSRFPSNTRVANAKSREVIELVVPARYHDDPLLFLQLARHLPLNSSPGLWEARARKIVEEMAKEHDFQVWLEVVADAGEGVGICIEDGSIADNGDAGKIIPSDDMIAKMNLAVDGIDPEMEAKKEPNTDETAGVAEAKK